MITVRTSKFAVFELPHKEIAIADLVAVSGSNLLPSFQQKMQQYGSCIVRGAVPHDALLEAATTLKPLVCALLASYDEASDEFGGVDQSALGVTRLPRIGLGKHNIHLDPYECHCHTALVQLLDASGICALVSDMTGKTCEVRETGFSMTRPKGGDGMEWHSDGGEGEFTVLMALEDVAEEQGTLGVVPESHRKYVPGFGHGDIAHNDYSGTDVRYAYRAGQPIVNDARTIHGVDRNRSNRWRVITWYILDVY